MQATQAVKANRDIGTHQTHLVQVKQAEKFRQGRQYFSKKHYLVPERVPEILMYEAMLLEDTCKFRIYIPHISIFSTTIDYIKRGSNGYELSQGAKEEYPQEFAIYPAKVIQIMAEEIVKSVKDTNLWCEGSTVDLHYYLMIIESLDRATYLQLKESSKIEVPMTIGDKRSKALLDAANQVSSLSKKQLACCLKLLVIQEKQKQLADVNQRIHAECVARTEEFNKEHKGKSSIEEFLALSNMLTTAHATLMLSPVARERFRMTFEVNPALATTYHVNYDTLEPIDPIDDFDLNQGLVEKYASAAMNAINSTNLSSPGVTKFNTIPTIKHLPQEYVAPGQECLNVKEQRELEKRVLSLKKNMQLPPDEVKNFLKAGWKFNDERCLVSPRKLSLKVELKHLRSFFNSADGIKMLQKITADREAKKLPKHNLFLTPPPNPLQPAQMVAAMEAQPQNKAIWNDVITQANIHRDYNATSTRIKDEIMAAMPPLKTELQAKFSASLILKMERDRGMLIPPITFIAAKLSSTIRKKFLASESGTRLREKLKKNHINIPLSDLPEYHKCVEDTVKSIIDDTGAFIEHYLNQFIRNAVSVYTLKGTVKNAGNSKDILAKTFYKTLMQIENVLNNSKQPDFIQKYTKLYNTLANYRIDANFDVMEEKDEVNSMFSVVSASASALGDVMEALGVEYISTKDKIIKAIKALNLEEYINLLTTHKDDHELLREMDQVGTFASAIIYDQFINRTINGMMVAPYALRDIAISLFYMMYLETIAAAIVDFTGRIDQKQAKRSNAFRTQRTEYVNLFLKVSVFLRTLITAPPKTTIELPPAEAMLADSNDLFKTHFSGVRGFTEKKVNRHAELCLFLAISFRESKNAPDFFVADFSIEKDSVVRHGLLPFLPAKSKSSLETIFKCIGEYCNSHLIKQAMVASPDISEYITDSSEIFINRPSATTRWDVCRQLHKKSPTSIQIARLFMNKDDPTYLNKFSRFLCGFDVGLSSVMQAMFDSVLDRVELHLLHASQSATGNKMLEENLGAN